MSLIFFVHLFDDAHLKIAASMNLAKIAREEFTDAQLRVIGQIKLDLPPLDKFLFGSVLGQNWGIPRLCVAGASDKNIFSFLSRLGWARRFSS